MTLSAGWVAVAKQKGPYGEVTVQGVVHSSRQCRWLRRSRVAAYSALPWNHRARSCDDCTRLFCRPSGHVVVTLESAALLVKRTDLAPLIRTGRIPGPDRGGQICYTCHLAAWGDATRRDYSPKR